MTTEEKFELLTEENQKKVMELIETLIVSQQDHQ